MAHRIPISLRFIQPSKTKLAIYHFSTSNNYPIFGYTLGSGPLYFDLYYDLSSKAAKMFKIKNRSVRQILPTDCLTGLNLINHKINHH